MNQDNPSAYLYRKIDTLEEQVVIIMRKCSEYDILVQKKRVDEDRDVERVKSWIQEKDRKEAKTRSTLDNMKKQLDADENFKKRQQGFIDELYDEIQYIHEEMRNLTGQQLENEVLEKLEKLTKSVDDLQNSRGSSTDITENESEFEREMRSVTDIIVQNSEGAKENKGSRNIKDALENMKTDLENQKEQIKSHKITQELSVKSTNLGFQSIRNDISGLYEFRNATIDRVNCIQMNIDEIDFYAREMYDQQRQQKTLIERLVQENEHLRKEYTSFQEHIFAEIQALRDEMANMKKAENDQKEMVDPPKSVPAENNYSKKTKSFVPIEEAIIGEWKLLSAKNMEKLCSANKSLNLVIRKMERIKISIQKGKLTTYYVDNKVYKKEKRFKLGSPDSKSNCWFLDNQNIKSINYFDSSKESAELCTRFINKNEELVVVNEINGCMATRCYEKIC